MAAAVATAVVVPVISKVSYSGAWDGDPVVHNRLVLDAVNTAVAQHAKGEDPARGFLQCYYVFPKVLSELLLTAFILALNGFNHVSFAEVERFAAWFETVWTLMGFVVLYRFLRLFFTRIEALGIMPIVALSGYILMYANFPRQNMPSHVLSWAALLLYVRGRLDQDAKSATRILVSGVAFGAAVAVHYSATYLVFALAAVEAGLMLRRRRLLPPLISLTLCIAGASLLWCAIDLFYFIYANKYPHDTNYFGQVIRNHQSFLEGMIHTSRNLTDRVAAFKLEDRKWWFLPGFIFRCLGPVGAILIVAGILRVPSAWRTGSPSTQPRTKELLAVIGATAGMSILVSLEYFQNARKLMPFYPVWCVLLGFGLVSICRSASKAAGLAGGERALGSAASGWTPVLSAGPAASLAYLLTVGVHFATFGPSLARIYECRRDAGYMREFLAGHGIGKIGVAAVVIDSPMAPTQTRLQDVTPSEADTYDYIVIHRLIATHYAPDTMPKLRAVNPVVAYPTQVATPLFWYEFPLKKEFMDFDDPLTNERALYRWKDVRDIFRSYLKASP